MKLNEVTGALICPPPNFLEQSLCLGCFCSPPGASALFRTLTGCVRIGDCPCDHLYLAVTIIDGEDGCIWLLMSFFFPLSL